MPRNGSGTYSLPSGNPVVTGTVISSTVHNNTMSDIASELTNSVDKDGQTVITGTIDFNGNKIILDVDGDTSITSDTDDQIDFEISGADDFQMVANIFKALSGSSIETDTINETTADNGVVVDSVTLKDGNVVLGSGNGIDFSATADGGTASSEILDDYEEGTWTPNLTDGTNSASYDARDGHYTKVGNVCTVSCYIDLSGLGSVSGDLFVTGLPFQPKQDAQLFIGGTFAGGNGLNITAGRSAMCAVEGSVASSRLALLYWDSTGGQTRLQHSEIVSTGVTEWSITYLTE